jgi:DGQHR domain-containing protein
MVVTAMNPDALVKAVHKPDEWNPLGSQAHGNRKVNKPHVAGISEYLETEEHFVIGAVVLYADPSEARVTADPGQDDRPVQTGTLHLEYGAQFDVGDGQHRIAGYDEAIRHRGGDRSDPVIVRLHNSGQPVIVVIDGNPLHRAQDFTDLQKNSKPITSSLANSMDRRQRINRLLIRLIQDTEAVPVFEGGARIEFQSDTPGKYSANWVSYKTLRYVSGLVLGVNARTVKGWDAAVNALVEADEAGVRDTLVEFWAGLGKLAPLAAVADGESKTTMADMRAGTYLASAGALAAIGWAAHLVTEDLAPGRQGEAGWTMDGFIDALSHIDFARAKGSGPDGKVTEADTILAGTVVDEAGRISGAQSAFEAAAEKIAEHVITWPYGEDHPAEDQVKVEANA